MYWPPQMKVSRQRYKMSGKLCLTDGSSHPTFCTAPSDKRIPRGPRVAVPLEKPSRTSALNLALIVPLGASVSFSASDIVRDPRAFTHSRIVRDSLGSALANLFHAPLSV